MTTHYHLGTTTFVTVMFRSLLRRPALLIGILIFLFLIVGLRVYIGRPLTFLFSETFSPVQAFLYRNLIWLKTHPLLHRAETNRALEERDALRDRVVGLSEEVGKLRFAADENKTLRQLLKFREERGHVLVAARVLARRMTPGTFVVILDRGASDGVVVGMPLVTGEGMLIGKVIAVRETVADAVFLPDARFRAAGTLSTSLETSGYVHGEGGVSMMMDLIPADLAVKAGDVVVTSGLEPGIPRGLVLGAIERIVPGESQLFHRAFMTAIVPLATITDVAIILPPAQ